MRGEDDFPKDLATWYSQCSQRFYHVLPHNSGLWMDNVEMYCAVYIYIYIQKPIPNSAIGGQRLLRKIAGGAEDDPALLRRHSLQQREIETSLDQVPRASIQMAVRWIVIGPWIVVVWTW